MIFNYCDYTAAAGGLVYDGGDSLVGDFVRTDGDGYIHYTTPSGFPYKVEYINFDTQYSTIADGLIRCTIDPDYTSFYWYVGAFSIAFDSTDYSAVNLVVQSAVAKQAGQNKQDPLCQIVRFYDSTDIDSGTILHEGEQTVDISGTSGMVYLRFIGELSISKIELT